MNNNNFPILQTPDQAAKLLGVSAAWIREEVSNGTLPHMKVGSRVYIDIPLAVKELHRRCNIVKE